MLQVQSWCFQVNDAANYEIYMYTCTNITRNIGGRSSVDSKQ